jgi:hypothetical protein
VRDALHQTARAQGCDFPGPGSHSFTTWQQVRAIEAAKIASHSSLEMTGQYPFVRPERQNGLARAIQAKLAAVGRTDSHQVEPDTLAALSDRNIGAVRQPNLACAPPVTDIVQWAQPGHRGGRRRCGETGAGHLTEARAERPYGGGPN